jgi:hypothetical protein
MVYDVVRAAQAFSLHAAGMLGDAVVASYYDPSGGEQAGSTAFPVHGKVLTGGGGGAIEVGATLGRIVSWCCERRRRRYRG